MSFGATPLPFVTLSLSDVTLSLSKGARNSDAARGPSAPDVRKFTANFSIEALPREVELAPGDLAALPPGTSVYLTRLATASFSDSVRAAKHVRELGFRPVPHISARTLHDERELRENLDALVSEAGVDDVLLIAGSPKQPMGAFAETVPVLETGAFQDFGITHIGLAAHPEGHPDMDDARLQRALDEKNAFAAATGLDLYLITQFFFDAAPVIAWERRIRERGNRLPIRAGLHGVAGAADLFKHALDCGIGSSIGVLAEHKSLFHLALVRAPDRLLEDLARAAAADPESLLTAAHFFPLGALRRTAEYASALALRAHESLPPLRE